MMGNNENAQILNMLHVVLAQQELQRVTNKHYYEGIMAQLDDLNTALSSIGTEVGKVGTDMQTLVTQLQTANQNPAVDLSAPIASAQAILGKLQGIDALMPEPAVAAPAPAA